MHNKKIIALDYDKLVLHELIQFIIFMTYKKL